MIFLEAGRDISQAYLGVYDGRLVVLSVLIAILAMFGALRVCDRIQMTRTAMSRLAWICAGVLPLGGGIWTMHFIGMIAFSLPISISYHPVGTLLSIIPAIGTGMLALWLLGREGATPAAILVGGVLVGAGIGLMHYSGMAAMRLEAEMAYAPDLFAASIVFAVILAVLSLWLKFNLHRILPNLNETIFTWLAAISMGTAISGMHYIAMEAAYFFPTGSDPNKIQGIPPAFLAIVTATFAVLLAALTQAASSIGWHRETNRELQEEIQRRERLSADLEFQKFALDEHAIVSVMDVNGNITYVNDRFVEISGYDREELLGQHYRFIRSDEHSDSYFADLWATISSGKTWHGEIKSRRKNGKHYWVQSTFVPFLDEIGKPFQFIAIRTDISERKFAEQSVRENEERLQAVSDSSVAAIVTADQSGRIVSWNPAARNMFGHDEAEILSQPLTTIIPEGQRSRHQAGFARAVSDGDHQIANRQMELFALHKTGREFPVELSLGAWKQGGEKFFTAVINDISERYETQQQLFALSAAVEAMSEPVAVFDADDCFIFSNQAYRSLNAEVAETIARGKSFEDHIRAMVTAGLAPDSSGREESWVAERMSRHRNPGNYFELQRQQDVWYLGIEKKLDDGGQVLLLTDISDLKRTQTELVAAKNLAEAANQSKSAFLANMSHEIRTPMNGVLGMAEILARTNLQFEQSRMINTIQNSAKALLVIIDDILDVSKIEAGRLELENKPVRLLEVIEGVIRTTRTLADDSKVIVRLRVAPGLPNFIRSDATRLRQIMMNLLSNAIKFSEPGDGDQMGEVFLNVQLGEGNTLLLNVSDNGIGMSPEIVDRLFRPFTQGEESTTRKFGGTGLGLVITENLVRLMGGEIKVDSTPGTGSTFSVRLPIDEADGEIHHSDISGLKLIGLMATDELREVFTLYAEAGGAEIQFAKDEEDLHQLISSAEPPVIVLLSMDTPDLNNQIQEKANELRPDVRFLKLAHDPGIEAGFILPNSYTIQIHPTLPSEFQHGLAVLAGRESPDIDPFAAPGSEQFILSDHHEHRLILLVEDNETNQEVITTQVKMLGHGIETADNGRIGLEKWQKGNFDLVLTDCHMPEMDGFQLTEQIRQIEEVSGLRRTPIIAITANALAGEDARCLAAGMDGYLSKPVQLELLRNELDRWFIDPAQSE